MRIDYKKSMLVAFLLTVSTSEGFSSKGIEDLPATLSVQEGNDNHIMIDGYDEDILLEGSWYFDWDEGSLTSYGAPAGKYVLHFNDEESGVSKELEVSVLEDTQENQEDEEEVSIEQESVPTVEKKAVKKSVKKVQKSKKPVETSTALSSLGKNAHLIEVAHGESIEAAIKTAVAGDTILVHGGVYDERIDVEYLKGTANNWITISNYPGEKPVLYASETGKVFNIEHSAYVKLNGFVIKEPKGVGIRVFHSHHVIVSNNEVYGEGKRGNPGGGAHAIVADGRKGKESHDILITGNYLHHNLTRFDVNGNKTDDETLTVKGAVSYATVENNRVVDNQFIGIDIIGPEYGNWGHSHHNVIRNNYVARNGGKYGDAVYVDGGKNHIVEYNTVEENRGSGISISQEHEGKVQRGIIVRYNKVGNQQENQVYIGDTSGTQSDIKHILFENNYLFSTKAADNAHVGIGAGDNVQMNGNYFDLSGKDIIRKVYDAGGPSMRTNSIKANLYANKHIQEEVETLGWGSVSAGKVVKNDALKTEAGADMSRIPPANSSSLILGDRALTTTKVSGSGHRIKL